MKIRKFIIGIIQIHCIVLADYAGRYYAPLELAPTRAQYIPAWEQAHDDVFVKSYLEQY